jgi:hypothetical protein
MTIFEKIDRVRHRRDINLCKPVTQPNTAEVSPAEPDASKPKLPAFLKQSTTESAMLVKSVTPISTPIKLMDQETPAAPDRTET